MFNWNPVADLPEPTPQLSPIDVVKIQLDALQNNDIMPHNQGLHIAFQHTSPTHKKAINSLETFAQLLTTSLYRAMIGFERAELETLHLNGDIARQIVRLIHKEDEVLYSFLLSQQQTAPYIGCWMTDAMLPLD